MLYLDHLNEAFASTHSSGPSRGGWTRIDENSRLWVEESSDFEVLAVTKLRGNPAQTPKDRIL